MQKQYLPLQGCKLHRFMGGSIGPRLEIYENSGLLIGMIPRFHKRNVYIKRMLRVWRTQKCIALVHGKIPPTSAQPQTTPFYGGQFRAGNGNMRNFGPTNPHSTAFAPKQWLFKREATCRESSKMNCPSRCRNHTYQCGAAIYPVSLGAV